MMKHKILTAELLTKVLYKTNSASAVGKKMLWYGIKSIPF